jgi:hypothetical protein
MSRRWPMPVLSVCCSTDIRLPGRVKVPSSAEPTSNAPPKAITRQELYNLAWQEPMLRVAERFGVSSSYLARVFTEMRVPRPALGYWTKHEFGKSPPKPELPPARPGDLTEWRPGTGVGTAVRTVAKATRKWAAVPAGLLPFMAREMVEAMAGDQARYVSHDGPEHHQ